MVNGIAKCFIIYIIFQSRKCGHICNPRVPYQARFTNKWQCTKSVSHEPNLNGRLRYIHETTWMSALSPGCFLESPGEVSDP